MSKLTNFDSPAQHPPGTPGALVTLFRSATDTAPLNYLEIGSILSKIGTSKPPDIDELRSLYHSNRAAYDERKKRLPAVTFGGKFAGRKEATLEAHSGFIVLDLDNLEGILSELREEIEADRYTYACFLSPSGAGLKMIVRIEATDAKEHKRCFDGLKSYYLERFSQAIDTSGRDASRLCFLSYDPSLTVNESAETFPLPPAATRTKVSTRSAEPRSIPLDNGGIQAGDVDKVRKLLSFLPRLAYDEWIRVIAAVQSVLSDVDALAVLQEWSPEEKEGEYLEKLRSGLNQLGAGTLVHLAKAHGYTNGNDSKVSTPQTQAATATTPETDRADGAQEPTGGPLVRSLGTVASEPTRWLQGARGYIPADLVSLSGEMGSGKSTVLIDLLACISTGRTWPNRGAGVTPANVLLICAEDRSSAVRGRMEAAGGDLSRCHELPVVWGEKGLEQCLTLPADLHHIEAAIVATGAVVVIIDPLESLLGSTDTHKGSSVRVVLTRLAAISHRTGAAIIYLGHPPKGATSAANSFGGSKAFVNAARAVFVVGPERNGEGAETGRYVLACRKQSAGALPPSQVYGVESSIEGDREAPPVIHWHGTTKQTADETMMPPPPDPQKGPTTEDRARTAILDKLKAGPLPATDLESGVRSSGIGRDSFARARSGLHNEGAIETTKAGFQEAVIWRLTEAAPNSTGGSEPPVISADWEISQKTQPILTANPGNRVGGVI
jgi:hypothetical protein